MYTSPGFARGQFVAVVVEDDHLDAERGGGAADGARVREPVVGRPDRRQPSMPPYVSQMIGPNRSNIACFAGIGHGADPWSTRFIDDTS